MFGAQGWMLILPTLILILGVVSDLRSRKIPNKLNLILYITSLIYVFVYAGFSGVMTGVVSSLIICAIMFPMVAAKIIGAGDLKLMLPFAVCIQYGIVFWVLIYSLFWAAVLGVIRVLIQGQIKTLFQNMVTITTTKSDENIKLHTLPFSVALLFGWLSYLVISGGL